MRLTGAAKETAQIGAASAPGIQLKTVAEGLVGLREIPINSLSGRIDEALAYNAEQADWKLALAAERMAPRITADVFNLITIGDGLLGGSATIRFAIINQGVQEFRVKVPVLWKNVEFTGPNIRRKELKDDTWVIGLQDKAWGGYTLVVTYDYQFDPHKATLPIGGIHPDGVERETGSVAITSAANLKLAAQPNGDNIQPMDEVELAANDRSLITRPVLMAYKYQGATYGLSVDVTQYGKLDMLKAVADRTQLTTVLTDAGEMLTQASFMVKNNDSQFQTFTLPDGAEFWACYVGGEPVKPGERRRKTSCPIAASGQPRRSVCGGRCLCAEYRFTQVDHAAQGCAGRAKDRHANNLCRVGALRAHDTPSFWFRRQHDRRPRHHLRPPRRFAGIFTILRCALSASQGAYRCFHRRRSSGSFARRGASTQGESCRSPCRCCSHSNPVRHAASHPVQHLK